MEGEPTKAEIRRQALARLRSLELAERRELADRALSRLWSLPSLAEARSILLYASLPEEMPTDRVAVEARRRGLEVIYPRTVPTESELYLHRVGNHEELRPGGGFGIREPAPDAPLTALSQIDFAIIPGLAWDREGNRLGRGAGYFDRLLARPEWRAVRCGLFFSVQEFPLIPTNDWDQPLDLIVTDREALAVAR